jgi:hypothetical protein
VLVITAYPDDRASTRDLRALVFESESCPNVDVHVWFLRCTDYEVPWPESRVVDDLRTWWPARALSVVGLEPLAARLRGARLRWWLREVDPDVVVFDDGFGERIVEHAPRRPRRIVRLNREPPLDRGMEPSVTGPVDLVLADPSIAERVPASSARRVLGPYFAYRPGLVEESDASTRSATRERLGLPTGPLLVGWGNEGWLDGPDIFVRTLWAVRRRGIDADAVWFGIDAESGEGARLLAEAERCDMAGRLHLRPPSGRVAHLCGDAVLCSDRSEGRSAEELIEPVVAGCPVVTSAVVELVDDDVHTVPILDVEAAAEALVPLLTTGAIAEREERRRHASLRLDICGSLAELFAAGDGGRA